MERSAIGTVVSLRGDDLRALYALLGAEPPDFRPPFEVRIATNGEGLRLAVDARSWSAPFGQAVAR